MSDQQQRAQRDRILDAGALRALAHPLRVKMYDILSQYGPQTASSLAERLGESSGATSYHLRALAKHDLIQEVEGRGTARERWWQRPVGSVTMGGPESMRTPAGRAATQLVIGEFYRMRHEQLMGFLQEHMRDDGDAEVDVMLSTSSARLTSEQFHDLQSRIQRIIDETVEQYRDQKGDDVRLFSMRVDIIPLTAEGDEQ